MIFGITGGTGCGKTTLLHCIARAGGRILDCDAIYHHLLETDAALLAKIEKDFPGTVKNGVLQRKKLGELVFSDPAALETLNTVTHAAVRAEVERQLADAPPLAAIDAIALFESGLAELCGVTIAVTAPEEARVQRLMARDGIDARYARRRIAAQHPQHWFTEKCTHTLSNQGTQAEFQEKCIAFLRQYGIIVP